MAITYHTYADVDFLRDTLAGTSYASGWTADAEMLLTILQRSSLMIDAFVGDQSFGPVTATRSYDLGSGSLVSDPRSLFPSVTANEGIQTTRTRREILPLDRWLISPTTVTSYSGSSRTTSETLTQGLANDFLLEPYNSSPKVRLKMSEESAKSWNSGQQVITILGTWGYAEDKSPDTTTINAAITSTTATSCTVASASNLSPGNTIIIDTEQLYVRSISSTTLTVIRGVNGSTAATHSDATTVERFIYPADVTMVSADIARILYRDRDMGILETIGSGEQSIRVRPQVEVDNALMTLDHYRVQRNGAGVIF